MIDLHTHSTVSDGSDAPQRIPELAAEAGCSAVALTDHDRLDGVEEARGRAEELGITLVAGCELSCVAPAAAGSMHVLVYFVEPTEGPLQDKLAELQEVRDHRNRALAERLGDLGLPVTYDEMQEEAGGSGAGRPHAAAILVRKGVVGSVREAFEQWLGDGRPGYVERTRLEPAEALRLVGESGGVAAVAHPLSMKLADADLEATMRELADLGMAGMECTYGRYSPEERDGLAGVARRLGLVVTGGSDHHGTYKPDLRVGVGQGDLEVPDQALEELAARRPS
ncbi:MAG TPA: PHP domain-containing protein [Acidimicrobiales bacterium]|nr:PHP domain-containing protein [Acidimicrobiales bacterium]